MPKDQKEVAVSVYDFITHAQLNDEIRLALGNLPQMPKDLGSFPVRAVVLDPNMKPHKLAWVQTILDDQKSSIVFVFAHGEHVAPEDSTLNLEITEVENDADSQ